MASKEFFLLAQRSMDSIRFNTHENHDSKKLLGSDSGLCTIFDPRECIYLSYMHIAPSQHVSFAQAYGINYVSEFEDTPFFPLF
jgi:hypothetical protein